MKYIAVTIEAKDDKEFAEKASGYEVVAIIRVIDYGHNLRSEYSILVKI